ncbi:MAG TPA: alpha-2-macroglobulin family protein [Gemmataceae bacterium]|nr:alpha-2-macroglobulin family protein [Gemmataceae bacterium]
MSTVSAAPVRIGPRCLVFFGIVALVFVAALCHSDPPRETKKLPPARNPERLHLLADANKVVGWISGTRDHAGAAVTVVADKVRESVTVQPGNTFTWPYKVQAATRAVFSFDKLRETISVEPPAKLPPCVFFAVDRGVYRPKQTLHFAAFLRDLDSRGEFVPRPAQTVEVQLTGETKNITAARLKLTSDAQGRIIGDYTFSDADPLDTYRLSIPSYNGAARVSLAEYRKSKNRLNIVGERKGSRLMLRFQARDYLDWPVKGARVQFTAQVVHEAARSETEPLDSKQFAYADEKQAPLLRPRDLTTEERLLLKAEDGWEAITGLSAGQPRRSLFSVSDKLALDDHGDGVHSVRLRIDWLRPGHSLVVQGVMIDGNGREERQTKTIPLSATDDALKLSLPRTTFAVNELIHVTVHTHETADAENSPTLIATRLSPSLLTAFDELLEEPPLEEWLTIPVADWGHLRRDLAAAVVFKGNSATLRLREPGVYRLTALWPRREGPPLRQEMVCSVLANGDRPVLSLHLDRARYQSGETLTGTVFSKFADARVLLTLRDSAGLRLWKPLRLIDGKANIKLTLPENIHYGCVVEVQYADSNEPPFITSRHVHVDPTGRKLTVRSEIKPVLEPGEQAVLNVQVNRKEPVDLIVSVYDKALLQIAPDRSPDIRNFYLADDRIAQHHAREALRRRLGDVTVDELIARAKDWLKKHPDQHTTAEGIALRSLVRRPDLVRENGIIGFSPSDLATLLRLAGIRARNVGDLLWAWLPEPVKGKPMTMWAFLEKAMQGGNEGLLRLQVVLIDDTFLLYPYQPGDTFGFRSLRDIGMMGGMGIGGIAGLGGIGGIAGFGGQGFQNLGAARNFQGQGNMGNGGVAGFGGLNSDFQGGNLLGAGGGFAGMIPPLAYQPPTAAYSLSIRRNFADSAYWNAKLRTDADGKARVAFKVPDSLTGWQVVVTAVSKDMRVGRHETSFRTARTLMVQPILPRFFTEGDQVRIAANVHNLSETRQAVRVRLKADNGKVADDADKEISVEAHGSGTVSWDFQAGDAGTAELLMSAEAPAGNDASLKQLPIVRAGVEHVITTSGFCKDAATIKLPAGVDPARAVLEVRFAPTLTADLLDTLPFLVEYPYGCVEQTMSRFLPAIKVAQILKQLRLKNPELEGKLPRYVAAGIKRLLELQHDDGGWGWWVNDQTHTFMTAYALYGLMEAKRAGYPIGKTDAIANGLARLRTFFNDHSKSSEADRIWCLYVLSQHDALPPGWSVYLDACRKEDTLSDYTLALSLELAVQHKKQKLAASLAADLRRRAKRDGGEVQWTTGGFAHWGDDRFEVTAAALKALVAFDKDDPLIPGVLAYFAATKRGNRWNSTKDTALIIQAMCDYLARRQADPHTQPHVALRCNDGPEQQAKFAGPAESCLLKVPSDRLRAGVNRLTFRDASDGMMFRACLRYHVAGRNLPAESHGIKVRRRWWLLDAKGQRDRELKAGDEVPCGAYLESTVEARPTDGAAMQFVLVENPRPAGCEVLPVEDPRFPEQQQGSPCLLREDRDKLIAFHHDQTQGQIVDRCVLHAEMPGVFLVSPAHVEMMYRTQTRGHSGTFTFRVAKR